MKKLFAGLTAAIMSFTALGATAFAADAPETKEYALGDVNMDGVVNTSDALLMLNDYTARITGLGGILSDEQLLLADVDKQSDENGDAVNLRDVKITLDYYNAKTHAFLIPETATVEEVAALYNQYGVEWLDYYL